VSANFQEQYIIIIINTQGYTQGCWNYPVQAVKEEIEKTKAKMGNKWYIIIDKWQKMSCKKRYRCKWFEIG
jgi:hypothetical protein